MFGHLWVEVDDEDDEEFPVAPVVPEASSAFVSDCVVRTVVVFARAGVLAALAIAAPLNPSPNAPETTAAAMSGFFIRIFQLLYRPAGAGTFATICRAGYSTERSWSRAVGAESRSCESS